MNKSEPVLLWKITCVDKAKQTLFDRVLTLDTSKLGPADKEAILRIAQGAPGDPAILAYRSSFTEVQGTKANRVPAETHLIATFSLPDYFEDEHANPLGPVELTAALSGDPNPIILGRPESVLRLGPAGIKARSQWSQQTANEIGRFLRVVKRIIDSRWLRSPMKLKTILRRGGADAVHQLMHPDTEATSAVCLCIRQLYSDDKALENACTRYLQHVDDERKKWWVSERLEAFRRFLERKPGFYALPACTARRLLDVFIYGSGLLHPRSKKKVEGQLASLVAKHGRERVVMAFGSCCWELCGYAFDLHPVIKQDFEHWIEGEGCVGPDWPCIEDLLRPGPGAG